MAGYQIDIQHQLPNLNNYSIACHSIFLHNTSSLVTTSSISHVPGAFGIWDDMGSSR